MRIICINCRTEILHNFKDDGCFRNSSLRFTLTNDLQEILNTHHEATRKMTGSFFTGTEIIARSGHDLFEVI